MAEQPPAAEEPYVRVPDIPAGTARGITLLEVLTVLAVVALLLALLLPIRSRGRQQGRLATCISNLRQILAALKMYEGDHGRLPVHLGAKGGLHWREQIQPYLSADSLFLCPADSTHGKIYSFFGRISSYVYFYTQPNLGEGGRYREPLARSPLVGCASHPEYMIVFIRNDGSLELPPHARYRRIGVEFGGEKDSTQPEGE